jgi:hypothetical protein
MAAAIIAAVIVLGLVAVVARMIDRFDCGHACCDQRRNRWHTHTVSEAVCTSCMAVPTPSSEVRRSTPRRNLGRLTQRSAR